ncbi:hypothetical protein DS884_18190 [Tenacibaculum sp. E3R01]|uniref:hypothetical protein n=1 Tax=Tenacibaculum sp. E3R01 TaxID=2267227 RepID=UPI000DE90C7D|nr:hypothetical protein [Tenacibaculum sp. E3R01]RBW54132.1 hypothetical protein DS884_18190 [Tenacibaculum sp. E3R01]
MKRKIITLLILVIFISFGHAQSEKINIKTDHLTEVNYLKMDDFYLTHYLYIDLFLRENLFPEANTEDVSSIIKALKKYVSIENKLEIEIEKPGKRSYLIRFAILKKDDGTELLIAFTNWSVKKKKFEKEIKIENNSYTRWYFLNGNKMTYRKDMSNQNDYSTTKKSDLANAYLFDELSDNDTKIKSTLDELLNKSDLSISDKIMGNLLLLKYLIFKKNNENVTKQVKYLNQLFETNKTETNLRGLKIAFNATKFQIELTK